MDSNNNITPEDVAVTVSKTRNFIERNASVIIAVSSVATALAVRKNVRISRAQAESLAKIAKTVAKEMQAREAQVSIIEQCIDQGRKHTFYPGLGVYVHEAAKAVK